MINGEWHILQVDGDPFHPTIAELCNPKKKMMMHMTLIPFLKKTPLNL